MNNHCFISNNTALAVVNKATEIRSEKSIAKSCSVSVTTVSRFIKKVAQQIHHRPFDALPEHLMMDEFKSVKHVIGSMSFIFADAITHQIVDIIEDRKLKSLEDYFLRFSLQERRKVKTVTIDMHQPYMSLIPTVFPNAEIIIDRFHIVQSLNRTLNMTRIKVMNELRYIHRPDYNKLKRFWKLILKPLEELELFQYKKVRLFKEWKTEKGIVSYLLNLDSQLAYTYSYVHQLRYHIKNNNVRSFENTLISVKQSEVGYKLKPVICTLKRYKYYIKNTIQFKTLTNGPIEVINNKIKTIKRVSYGYKNFENLRNRIILCSGLYINF